MAELGSISAEIDSLNQVFSLMEAFRAFDSDNDGFITVAELGGILGSLGCNASEQDVRSMMQQADTDKDGLLRMQEFLEMNIKDMEIGTGFANMLKTAFEALEVDGDNIITGEELHEGMLNGGLNLSLEDCQAIIASMDADGDGAVSTEDFQQIINSLL